MLFSDILSADLRRLGLLTVVLSVEVYSVSVLRIYLGACRTHFLLLTIWAYMF